MAFNYYHPIYDHWFDHSPYIVTFSFLRRITIRDSKRSIRLVNIDIADVTVVVNHHSITYSVQDSLFYFTCCSTCSRRNDSLIFSTQENFFNFLRSDIKLYLLTKCLPLSIYWKLLWAGMIKVFLQRNNQSEQRNEENKILKLICAKYFCLEATVIWVMKKENEKSR